MECKIFLKNVLDTPTYFLSPPSAKDNAIVLHGYGSNKEEIIGCALAIARANFNVYVPDLPGHGENKETFNLKTLKKFIEGLKRFEFKLALGHSLGARIVFQLPCKRIILISPPLEAIFDGTKKELLTILRARRVKEEKYYEGLRDALKLLPMTFKAFKEILFIYAKNDLLTVKEAAKRARASNIKIEIIPDANHNDIISSQITFKRIKEWLSPSLY